MAWYNTGTIALTNGSATVTGSGTNFLVGAQIGEALYAPDGKLYEIQTINSATVITLASNYLGSTASGQDYQIIPTQSLVADLASDVTDLISDFADVRDYAGNGKFNDGAVGTPGITFTQDQDNGLYRIGSNNWALAAGGIKQVDLSATDVEINYAGVKKLATSASGIDVTGTVTADGLTVDGNASTTGVLTLGNAGIANAFINSADSLYINIDSNNDQAGGNDFQIGRNSTGASSEKIFLAGENGDISFYSSDGLSQALFWDASAESLGIGTSSPSTALDVSGAVTVTRSDVANDHSTISNEGGLFVISAATGGGGGTYPMLFKTADVEAMRLDTSGNLLVGVSTAQSFSGVTAAQNFVTPTNGNWAAGFRNTTTTTPWGVAIDYTGANPNNYSSDFLYCSAGGLRFSVMSNGGIKNYQANDSNLSDRREKTNFSPAKSYLDAICAIPVQTFNYIDQNMEDDPSVTLGVVAQDVQTVAPELVMESNWGTEEDPKMRLSIYQTDLQYALMKCIQEQQATIEALTARIAALES